MINKKDTSKISQRLQNQVKLFEGIVVRIISNHDMFLRLQYAEEKTNLLTKSAPSFFDTLNSLLINDFFLESAKILENSKMPSTRVEPNNLTICLFAENSEWTDAQKIKLNEFSEKLKSFYPCIKNARDKLISHNDLSTYEAETESLGQFFEGLDVTFVKTLEEFYNYLHQITFGIIWGNFAPNVEPGSVQELITSLYHAQAFEEIIDDLNTPDNIKMLLLHKSLEVKGFNNILPQDMA